MSDDRARRDGDGDPEAGVSLLEVVISLAVLSVLFLVILRSTVTVGDTNGALEAYNLILLKTQTAVSEMHQDVATARKMYEEDAAGRAYFDAMNRGTLPAIASTLLPIIEPLGIFDQDDAATRKTGNCLLMVCELAPYDFRAPSNGKDYRVNVLRLVCFYVVDYGYPVAPNLASFDLARWESVAYADFGMLTSVTDATARKELVADMVANGRITFAWDTNQPVTAAFFAMTSDVSLTATTPFTIQPSPLAARKPRAYYRKYNAALAANNSVVGGEAAIPKFAQKVAGPPGFPQGFEVKVVGSSGARKIVLRVVAERRVRNQIMRGKSETQATMRDI